MDQWRGPPCDPNFPKFPGASQVHLPKLGKLRALSGGETESVQERFRNRYQARGDFDFNPIFDDMGVEPKMRVFWPPKSSICS